MKGAFSRDLFRDKNQNTAFTYSVLLLEATHVQNHLVLSSFPAASLPFFLSHLIQSSKDQYQKHTIHLRMLKELNVSSYKTTKLRKSY